MTAARQMSISNAMVRERSLRRGWTTGACATAAAKSAFGALLTGTFEDPVTVTLPRGDRVQFVLAHHALAPGAVLTSMVKRVDVAAYETLKDAMEGKFTAGVVTLGLAEGGVGWALDGHNAKLIRPEVRAAVEKAKADIVAGRTAVHDYVKDRRCPL